MKSKLLGLELPHVAEEVTNFIGFAREWTIPRACDGDHPRLMKLLSGRGVLGATDYRVLAAMCNVRLGIAARAGNLRVFEAFTRFFPNLVITTAASIAVRVGHAHIVVWLLDRDLVVWREEDLLAAARYGSISGVKRLLQGLRWQPTARMLHIAIEEGHVELAQWLWLEFCARDCLEILEEVIAASPLRLAQWMASRLPRSVRVSIDLAAERGDLQWIKWADARGAVASTRAMDAAAANGHHEVVVWLYIHRREGHSTSVINQVAKFGHVPVVRWLHEVVGCTWTSEALFNAAVNGHLELLQWFLQTRLDLACPPSTLDHAAGNGHLHVVEWMTVTSTSIATHSAMDWAAANGHNDVVFYLHDNRHEGCTSAAMDAAAANGNMGLLYFFGEERDEGCTTAAFDNAARNNQWRSLEYLHAVRDEGFTAAALRNAATNGSLGTVKWFVEDLEMPLTTEVMDAAIGSGNEELVRYLIHDHQQWWTKAGIDAAIMSGHLELLGYLQTLRPMSCSAEAVRAAVESGNLYLASWAFKYCDEPVFVDANDPTILRHGWLLKILRVTFA